MRSFFKCSKAAVCIILALLAVISMGITFSKYYNKLDLDSFSLNVTPAPKPEPILAPSDTWFTQGDTSVSKASITEIEIKDEYTPTGTAGTDYIAWDASAAKNGSVMAYVEGSKLTIAGNGTGRVYMNADSSNVFNGFTKMTSFVGSEELNASQTTTLYRAFFDCSSIETLDLNSWDTQNVTNLQAAFNGMLALKDLSVSEWNTSNVTNMQATFQTSVGLEELDLTGWDTSNVTTMKAMFGGLSTYGGPMSLTTIHGLDTLDTSSVETMESMFCLCSSLEATDVSGWDTSNVTTMQKMFYECTSLETLDVSNWNTSACTNMADMFHACSALTTLDVSNWDVSQVTAMNGMFYGCTSLTTLDVSDWDVGNVTDFTGMFECGSNYGENPMTLNTLDVSKWDTSSATDMDFMFYGCRGPKTIDVSGWDVSKVTTFDHMFAHSYLTIGDVSNWNTPAATNMNAMFHSVQNTTLNVSKLDTSNVTAFTQMFQSCTNLTEIIGLENFDTSNGIDFQEMFYYCTKLTELDLSSFDTTHAKNGIEVSANSSKSATLRNMFKDMSKLQKITLGANFSFNGDGTNTTEANIGVLPTPASGYWYTADGTAYAPAEVPSKTANTYYAVNPAA